jgi:hypothetical protein
VVSSAVSKVSEIHECETNGLRCAGCAGAASAYPLQSWIFSQLILVIALIVPDELARASAHWALMFFILAIGVGVAYFSLGWSSTTISTVRSLPPLGNRFLWKYEYTRQSGTLGIN